MKNTIMDISRRKSFYLAYKFYAIHAETMNYKLGKLFFFNLSGEAYLVNDKTQMSYRVSFLYIKSYL